MWKSLWACRNSVRMMMSCRNQNRRSLHLRDPLNHSMHQHPKNKAGPAKATRNLFFLVHLCPKKGPQSDTPSHSWHSMNGKDLGTPLPSKGHGSVQGSFLPPICQPNILGLNFCFPRLFFHFFWGEAQQNHHKLFVPLWTHLFRPIFHIFYVAILFLSVEVQSKQKGLNCVYTEAASPFFSTLTANISQYHLRLNMYVSSTFGKKTKNKSPSTAVSTDERIKISPAKSSKVASFTNLVGIWGPCGFWGPCMANHLQAEASSSSSSCELPASWESENSRLWCKFLVKLVLDSSNVEKKEMIYFSWKKSCTSWGW